MAQTVYQLTVLIPDDDTAPDGWEEKELAAQLRLAAQAVAAGSAPLPGTPPKLLTGGDLDARATTWLGVVAL